MDNLVLPFVSSEPHIYDRLHLILPTKSVAYDLITEYCGSWCLIILRAVS